MAKCNRCGKAGASKVTSREILPPSMGEWDDFQEANVVEEMLCADCERADEQWKKKIFFVVLFVILVISLYDFFFR